VLTHTQTVAERDVEIPELDKDEKDTILSGFGYLSSCFLGPCIYKFIDVPNLSLGDGKLFRQPYVKLMFFFTGYESPRQVMQGSPSPRSQSCRKCVEHGAYELQKPHVS